MRGSSRPGIPRITDCIYINNYYVHGTPIFSYNTVVLQQVLPYIHTVQFPIICTGVGGQGGSSSRVLFYLLLHDIDITGVTTIQQNRTPLIIVHRTPSIPQRTCRSNLHFNIHKKNSSLIKS